MIVGVLLYCLLGVMLVSQGINVIDKPWQFFGIIAVVAMIDLNSKFNS